MAPDTLTPEGGARGEYGGGWNRCGRVLARAGLIGEAGRATPRGRYFRAAAGNPKSPITREPRCYHRENQRVVVSATTHAN